MGQEEEVIWKAQELREEDLLKVENFKAKYFMAIAGTDDYWQKMSDDIKHESQSLYRNHYKIIILF